MLSKKALEYFAIKLYTNKLVKKEFKKKHTWQKENGNQTYFQGGEKNFHYYDTVDYVFNSIFIKYICRVNVAYFLKRPLYKVERILLKHQLNEDNSMGRLKWCSSIACQEQDKEIDRHRSCIPEYWSVDKGQSSHICKL